ncbi:MAG TPA: 8-amino-7-oxononanoate synthase, partial [Mucilaginibacter sp.]|nr:8-amino-7-oxononanoate synthase [Mucilaginibacter sp.]
QLASVNRAYDLLVLSKDEIQTLKGNIGLFKEKIGLKHNLLPSDSAIQCIVVDGNERTRQLAAQLQDAGFDIRPILSPTVPVGSERLRICLHSYNTAEEIGALSARWIK